jgi:hypothetical protein
MGNVFPPNHGRCKKLIAYSWVRSGKEAPIRVAYALLDCRRAVKL